MSPATLPLLIVLLVLTAALPSPLFVVPWLGAVLLSLLWLARILIDWRFS